ncbi:MAG: hypothetical protein Q4F72_02795 [Desulfovibrionaceae bacterium]|nr:hypothetical protein [Desulfovibrionaceae bacterium]
MNNATPTGASRESGAGETPSSFFLYFTSPHAERIRGLAGQDPVVWVREKIVELLESGTATLGR